jgi:hypothetical protein
MHANYLAKLEARNSKIYSPITIPPNGMSLLLLVVASGTLFFRFPYTKNISLHPRFYIFGCVLLPYFILF